jgi:hypothetical protein
LALSFNRGNPVANRLRRSFCHPRRFQPLIERRNG